MNLIRIVVVGLIFSVVGWRILNVILSGGNGGTGTWLSRAMPVMVLVIWIIAAISVLLRKRGRGATRQEQGADLPAMTYQPPEDVYSPPDIPAPPPDIPAPPPDPTP